MRRRAGGWAVVLGCLATTALAEAPASQPDDSSPGAAVAAREEALWKNILELDRPLPTTQPFDRWFEAGARQREALLDRVRLYELLYPGGVHRDEAVRLELSATFELATLRGGDLEPLSGRVEDLLRAPPSPAALHEAAYWRIVCRHHQQSPASAPSSQPVSAPSAQPTSAPSDAADVELLAAYREYIRTYPTSRHVPRLATLVFEDAVRRGDRALCQQILETLGRHFADHAVTAALQGEWRREEATGRPFVFVGRRGDGGKVDTRESLPDPLIIVVWAGFDAASRAAVQEVEAFRREHPGLRVVGVSLDDTPEKAGEAARSLGVDWPLCCDSLGWGGQFVREWGVRRLPRIFVVDRSGCLVGSTERGEWRAWAVQALSGPPPHQVPTTSPGG